jgi:hypothetical protein
MISVIGAFWHAGSAEEEGEAPWLSEKKTSDWSTVSWLSHRNSSGHSRKRLIESKGGAIGWREFVDEGGLMSNAANLPELCRQSARRVNKILKGSKPGDMPFEVPTRYELIVNLKMTKAIRLNFSDSFLVLADEVIQ